MGKRLTGSGMRRVTNDSYLTAKAYTRVEIDRQLEACGWAVQDRSAMNLYASHLETTNTPKNATAAPTNIGLRNSAAAAESRRPRHAYLLAQAVRSRRLSN